VNGPDLIVRIAARGEGVTADGRHVPMSVPGDRLKADGMIEIGPDHITPPCQHFPACGGCQLQHVSETVYADYVTGRIVDALHTQGIDAPPIDAPHVSPPRTRRRATMRAERTGKRIRLGFNEGASNNVIDLHECHLLLPGLFALIAPMRALLAVVMRDKARVGITLTQADQGIDLLLSGIEADGLAALEAMTEFGETNQLARLALDDGDGPSVRYAPSDVTVTLGGIPVALPEGAFLQATADGETALTHAVIRALSGASNIVDLFAGLGTFALSLPAKVHAVEGARDPALALAATKRLIVEHRDLFRRPLTVEELRRFDGAVIDPPRAGAKEQVIALAQSKVHRIAYVSCNPATFARDAKALIDGGYRLHWIKPVGQFRWSTHVELAAAFTR
jgi:23S rRNA (uracil1939-C5)-methyltransferase